MINSKKEKIKNIVDKNIEKFAKNISNKHLKELNNPNGTINSKLNNVFIASLNDDAFTFYSALCRSFDSSFGKVLENIGNEIAKLSYATKNEIDSYILEPQKNKISELQEAYDTDSEHRIAPSIDHYKNFECIKPKNIDSYKRNHKIDHCFYDADNDVYYLIQLKAGGDLDSVKAPAEKFQMLREYFMLKNHISDLNKQSDIKLYFAAAYNKNGEGNTWMQASVKSCFADDELLIGKDYWNFVCNDNDGFDVVLEQYKISCLKIKNAVLDVKNAYLNNNKYYNFATECEDVLDYADTTEELISLLINDSKMSEQEAVELLAKFLDENSTCETVSQDDVDHFIKKYGSN